MQDYIEKTEITNGDKGEIRAINHQIHTSNLPAREWASMLKNMAPKKRNSFLKDCRVVAVIPTYMPAGMFKQDVHAMNMTEDELDFLLKKVTSFKVSD